MATVLKINYSTSDGGSTIHTWRYADPDVTATYVNALISATITNASLFSRVPTAATSAKLVTTTESEITIS